MSPWALTIEQVEAGYAAYRWHWEHCHDGTLIHSPRWFSSVAAAAADADEHEPGRVLAGLQAATYVLPDGGEVTVRLGQKVLCTPSRQSFPSEPFVAVVTSLVGFPQDEQGRYIVPRSADALIARTDSGWTVLSEELTNTDPARCTSRFL